MASDAAELYELDLDLAEQHVARRPGAPKTFDEFMAAEVFDAIFAASRRTICSDSTGADAGAFSNLVFTPRREEQGARLADLEACLAQDIGKGPMKLISL